jgi:hypothetical protein
LIVDFGSSKKFRKQKRRRSCFKIIKMKKTNKIRSTKSSEAIKKEPGTASKEIVERGANDSFPQEYEEQRSMDIRMVPQPFVKPAKSED